MTSWKRSYTVYTIGVAIVWAVLLLISSSVASDERQRTIWMVFGGFVIGWVSATIARFVYPPPKKWRRATGSAP